MEWMLAVIFGFVFGTMEDSLPALAAGALLGWLLGRVIALDARVRSLEKTKTNASNERTTNPAPTPSTQKAPSAPATVAREIPAPVAQKKIPAARGQTYVEKNAPARNAFDWRQNPILRWLMSGNVPVKVGVLVSFFGVAFLLKYAVDQGWMLLPMEVRLAMIAAFGIGLLALGWRLRASHRVYALSIQGGGIGVLYLTTYAALRLFHVLPASMTFILLAAIAAGAGWLSVRQDARSLAVLGAIGGFLAPLLASTGSGSHVALFAYYLVLNIGIAGVAWFRHWRMLNLLGFVFTFGIGLAWGAQYYQEQYFASVEPFLVAYFLLFTTVAVLAATRQPFRLRGYVDSALVFGLPLVAFPLQAALVDGRTLPLAWTATALAAFYAGLALFLSRRFGETLKLLAQVYVALAVIFVTLAVPLWLDGPWVSNTWALEAAAMIVIGLAQRRALTHWGGVALLVLAVATYFNGLPSFDESPAILNEQFLGGFLLCAAFTVCAWQYAVHREVFSKDLPLDWITAGFAWFGWLALAHSEIFEHVANDMQAAVSLIVIAIGTVAMERAARRWVPHTTMLAASVLPLLLLHWIWWTAEASHLLADYGWLAWPLAFAALAWTLRVLPSLRFLLLPGATWLSALWLAVEIDYGMDLLPLSGADWDNAIVPLALVAACFGARKLAQHCFGATCDLRFAIGPVVVALLVYTVFWNLEQPGRFEPLPYIPVLNLLMLSSVVVAYAVYRFAPAMIPWKHWPLFFAALGLFLLTVEIARSTHHLADVRFTGDALWRSGHFQAALSIAWSLAGIAGMVLGARLQKRLVWFAGAGMMAAVVLKLFVVDLGNTGSLTRVVSFIGVGLLLLVVGYLAPAPSLSHNSEAQTE
ncbi:MAG TPA: DUF2339 domain-containing protein [Gammaproteobacteria bacterium]